MGNKEEPKICLRTLTGTVMFKVLFEGCSVGLLLMQWP